MKVFDLDGTLCKVRPGTSYEDPESLLKGTTPIPHAILAVRRLLERGEKVGFLTGRHESVKDVTFLQLLEWFGAWGGGACIVAHRQRPKFDWDDYVQDKADALIKMGATLYVGDREQDGLAAARAGVAFLPADQFHSEGVSLGVVA